MKILGLEKLSLVDYPGYACAVLFTGGCNFACPFCHNSGLVWEDVAEISQSEVLNFLTKRFGLLDAVCISGGEPTLQPDLKEFIVKIKNLGYKIKLDTNGTNPKVLEELINQNLLDYVAMDIKNSIMGYPITTNKPNLDITNVLESIEILKQNKVDYEFRTTIVKEFHTKENILDMTKMLQGAKKLYLQKYVASDNCINKNLTAVSKDTALKYVEILNKVVPTVLRGYV